MKLLMLRGAVPKDRNPKEIMFDSIDHDDDIWTNLAYGLGDEVEIAYWGGNRETVYDDKCVVRWVKSFKHYEPIFEPDIIWARGGFPEYLPILRRFPNAKKIYYGSGIRYIPNDDIKYHMVLCDTVAQKIKLAKKGYNAKLYIKPSVDIFKPIQVTKKYDIAFVANGGQAKIKNIKWVYKTVPKDLKVLHLGLPSKYKPPENVKCVRAIKSDMPKLLNMCKIGIIPYSSYDSAPRALIEMIACGLPIVVSDEVNIWQEKYIDDAWTGEISNKKFFWDTVRSVLKRRKSFRARQYYEEYLDMYTAIEHLKEIV